MGLRKELYERMVRERIAQELEADRHRRRVRLAVMGVCILWTIASLVIYAIAMRSYDREAALLGLQVGEVLGITGIVATLMWYKRWAEKEGEE